MDFSKYLEEEETKDKIELDNLIYSINENDKTVSIIGGTSKNGSIVIPRSITLKTGEYIVKSISKHAFRFSNIKTVIFSVFSEIQIVEKEAFFGSSIESFTIPPHLTCISESAFRLCKQLCKIEISDFSELRTIEKEAFFGSSIESFTIPPHLTFIGESAFGSCDKLRTIEIPKNSELETIEKGAFSGTLIECFKIPNRITKICEESFKNCRNLQAVEITNKSELHTIEGFAFQNSSIECFTIPSKLVEIKDNWCCETSKLTKLFVHSDNPCYLMHDDKIIIGKSSLSNNCYDNLIFACRDIKNVTIPDFIKTIKPYAFCQCKQLHQIKINSDSELQKIEKKAFFDSLIDYFMISNKVTHIGECAFSSCINLTRIEIPENSMLQTIENYAFYSSAIVSFSIPSHVKDVGEEIFCNCRNLKIVFIDENSEIEKFEINEQFACKSENDMLFMVPVNLRSKLLCDEVLNDDNFSSDDYPDFL